MGRDERRGFRSDSSDPGVRTRAAKVSGARSLDGRGKGLMAIEFRNVTKQFGGTCVVDDLSLEIHDGEFVVLLGPSGCGKTTSLRMLAGLENATSGDIFIDGQRVNDVPTQHRDVAMVFQSYALYPHMTI